MKKENVLLIASIVFGVAVLSFAVFTLIKTNSRYRNPDSDDFSTDNNNSQEYGIDDGDLEFEQPIQFIHSAWIPAFDFDNGAKSLEENVDVFSIVNPVFYGVNTNGTLLNRKPSGEKLQNFIDFCRTNEVKIIPTIGSFDSNTMGVLFSEERYVNTHIEEIIAEVEKYDFDGIDIDYEKIRSANKTAYLKFLSDLEEKLNQEGKILSVTVLAKTEDAERDVLHVQDWIEIGKIADQVRIMTYDYTLQTSTTPGPIGPKSWILDVVKYAQGKIPNEKIFLGIHLYAYLWKDGRGSALTHNSVLNILENQRLQSTYDEDFAEGYAQYSCGQEEDCVLYHQTKKGVLERINIAKENKFNGVAYWRLGGEADLLDFL